MSTGLNGSMEEVMQQSRYPQISQSEERHNRCQSGKFALKTRNKPQLCINDRYA